MSLKVKGKVIKVMPEQTGTSARGEWKKRDFVIETNEDQFPKKICFTLFNKVLNVGVGAEVEVSFNLESREYNDKWYTNLNAYNVELIGVAPIANIPPESSNTGNEDDLPF